MALLTKETTSPHIEVQKRACEYVRLLDSEWEKDLKGVCEPIPKFKLLEESISSKPVGSVSQEDFGV